MKKTQMKKLKLFFLSSFFIFASVISRRFHFCFFQMFHYGLNFFKFIFLISSDLNPKYLSNRQFFSWKTGPFIFWIEVYMFIFSIFICGFHFLFVVFTFLIHGFRQNPLCCSTSSCVEFQFLHLWFLAFLFVILNFFICTFFYLCFLISSFVIFESKCLGITRFFGFRELLRIFQIPQIPE